MMRIHRFERLKCVSLIGLLLVGFAAPVASQQAEAEAKTRPQVIVHPLLVRYTSEFLAHKKLRKHQVVGRDLNRILRDYQEVVTANLASEFAIVSKPGARVLRIDTVLVNHELDKSDWLVPTRDFFRGAPGVQIVAYVRDSQTGEILDRVGLTLRPRSNRMMKSSPGFYRDYMRKVFDRIATRVRWALEDGATTS
jgi:hypothetical protein